MRIRKSNSAKKLEMGDPLDVLKPQFAAKIRKKSLTVPKRNLKGGP